MPMGPRREAAPPAPGHRAPRVPGGAARAPDGKPPLVTLRADRALPYGKVMQVMGELNHAGFNTISLVTNGSVEAP